MDWFNHGPILPGDYAKDNLLSVGWFGFNVVSAHTIDKVSGLVAVNSLMAMAGGSACAHAAPRP